MVDARLEHEWMVASFVVAHLRSAWTGERVAPADITPYGKRDRQPPRTVGFGEFRAFARKMGVHNA